MNNVILALEDAAKNAYSDENMPLLANLGKTIKDLIANGYEAPNCLAAILETCRGYYHQLNLRFAEPVAPPVTVNEELIDGIYTVQRGNEHVTIKIRTQGEDANFAPGKRIASYLNGPDNWSNYRGFAFIDSKGRVSVWKNYKGTTAPRALEVLLSGREQMIDGLKAYGRMSKHCGRCGHLLTTPESLDRGVGPDCAAILGIA